MSIGLVALLDDIAAMAKLAAASLDDVGAAASRASIKAAGVVVDDTAVTPRYVTGFSPQRELPMIKRIAWGSLRNKIVFILPVSLLLSQFAPFLLTPLLMLGGLYLVYEGAEKVWEWWHPHDGAGPAGHTDSALVMSAEELENSMVAGAIRTDFILSAEIMVIALGEVADRPLLTRTISLIVVALLITIGVYGLVAMIVKMDDIGLHLAGQQARGSQALGRGLVAAMPRLLSVLGVVGTVAMLWVGGHILVAGTAHMGWPGPESVLHLLHDVAPTSWGAASAVIGWFAETLGSAVIGLGVGALVVLVLHLIPRRRPSAHGEIG
ncbi:Inner membrane protein YedI [Austwickia sp. TVS 96-490-7B]|uniref:DUF808 domain-containing protein n=1 Tax=Austwickia sp. TVS 96-490-7B TaxID=2830843 RepID=UPI001C57F22C|nr:DUF808 domain-containing protein [Austwickia sp. TVS 96-490-7B]MBW3086781.1 Inner membrane protein YedI [Austwickia sp. TVS 96-490-7B]